MYRFDKMFSRNNCMIPLLSTCLIKCPSRNHAIPIPSWNVEQRDDDDTSAASPLRFPTQKQSIDKVNFPSCWVWFNIIPWISQSTRHDIPPVNMEEFDKTTNQWSRFTHLKYEWTPSKFCCIKDGCRRRKIANWNWRCIVSEIFRE